jgi:hypothetical protein
MSRGDSFLLKAGESIARFSASGAECQAWRVGARAMLWAGDPAVWPAVAPVLFPTCGWSRAGVIRIGDTRYLMPVHGFAKSSTFDARQTGNLSRTQGVSGTQQRQRQEGGASGAILFEELDARLRFRFGFGHDILLLGVGLYLRCQPFEFARLELHEVIRLLKGLLEQHELRRIAAAVGVHGHRIGEIRLLDVLRGDWGQQTENGQALWVVWGCWRRVASGGGL